MKVIPKPNKVIVDDGFLAIGAKTEIEEIPIYKKIDECLKIPKEGYHINVNRNGIQLSSSNEQGMYYGEVTLQQLIKEYGDKLPYMTIEDEPRKKYRGFMIDLVRHFFSVEEIKKLIRICSLHKLNVLHLHLTDDQGWRIPVKELPKLVEIGSLRKQTVLGGVGDDIPVTGFYSTKELGSIAEYAKKHFIEIIPEIDMPGHVVSLLAAYPSLSCNEIKMDVGQKYGVYNDILCAGKEETFEAVFAILDEVVRIFRPKRIHIGGDEAPKIRWDNCPLCKERMVEENLKNTEELQGYFSNRIVSYLREKDVETILWNESLNSGTLDAQATIQFWLDGKKKERIKEAALSGRKIIVSEFNHLYLDYPYYMTPLSKTYSAKNILPKGINDDDEVIIGYEAPVWTEYIDNDEKLEQMIFPRLSALSELAWTRSELRNYKDFLSRLPLMEKLFRENLVSYTDITEANPKGLLAKIKTALYIHKIRKYTSIGD